MKPIAWDKDRVHGWYIAQDGRETFGPLPVQPDQAAKAFTRELRLVEREALGKTKKPSQALGQPVDPAARHRD